MDKRIIEISLQTAREWYESNNEALKKVALQAFSKNELTQSFRDIKTFTDAYSYLKKNNMCLDLLDEYEAAYSESYSETICKYRIVVAALTNNEERHLTEGNKYYPIVQFCKKGSEKNCYCKEVIGTIVSEGKKYTVTSAMISGTNAGLGSFHLDASYSYAYLGFRSVSRKEIAEHISKYFGRLLFDIMYGGVNCNWKWVD